MHLFYVRCDLRTLYVLICLISQHPIKQILLLSPHFRQERQGVMKVTNTGAGQL